MIATEVHEREAVAVAAVASHNAAVPVSLEEYYSEAGPDYAAWSPAFNMHFGFYRAGMNPFDREAMLEQMNSEVFARLNVQGLLKPRLLDLGCGLGATLRRFAQDMPQAVLEGMTRVPWQVEQAQRLNAAAGLDERIHVMQGDYEHCELPDQSYDAAYALESSCHANGADKRLLLAEAYRLLRPGGRLVLADGFLSSARFGSAIQRRIYRKLCECWVIRELAQLDRFTGRMEMLGFRDIRVEHLQMRVAPSVAHIPWVTVKFLLTDVLPGRRKMTRARWNNVLAPLLLPLVSAPLGPMTYCMISATKA